MARNQQSLDPPPGLADHIEHAIRVARIQLSTGDDLAAPLSSLSRKLSSGESTDRSRAQDEVRGRSRISQKPPNLPSRLDSATGQDPIVIAA